MSSSSAATFLSLSQNPQHLAPTPCLFVSKESSMGAVLGRARECGIAIFLIPRGRECLSSRTGRKGSSQFKKCVCSVCGNIDLFQKVCLLLNFSEGGIGW